MGIIVIIYIEVNKYPTLILIKIFWRAFKFQKVIKSDGVA